VTAVSGAVAAVRVIAAVEVPEFAFPVVNVVVPQLLRTGVLRVFSVKPGRVRLIESLTARALFKEKVNCIIVAADVTGLSMKRVL
jgi:hypothetical protein